MADRILIGKHGGKTLVRISKPGFDVKDEKNPMIFSSDNDYLKIHRRSTVKLSQWLQSGDSHWWAKVNFPALSYYPLVFYAYRSDYFGSQEVWFPVQDSTEQFWDYGCAVSKSNLWFSCSNWDSYGGANIYVDYVIFNTRME